jgi:hypothetical protein
VAGLDAAPSTASSSIAASPTTQPPVPRAYTPPHLVERILKSRAALEGERKQVTVNPRHGFLYIYAE